MNALCLSTSVERALTAHVGAAYSCIDSKTVDSNFLRSGYGPPMLGISRESDVHAIDAFIAASLIWRLNAHFLSSHTPRYLISLLRGISSPLIANCGGSYFLRRVTNSASHLCTASCRCLLFSQLAINSSASFAITSICQASSATTTSARSSANPTRYAPSGIFSLSSPSYIQFHINGPLILSVLLRSDRFLSCHFL